MADIPPLTMFPSSAWADRELVESDLRVLGVLCARFNRKTGQCNPSRSSIATNAGVSASTVKRALHRLKARGYIDWTPYWQSDGRRGRNDYVIVPFETDYSMPVMIPDTPAPRVTAMTPQPGSTGRPPAGVTAVNPPGGSPGWPGINREVEQRSGTENVNTAARIRETALSKSSKNRSPADDPLEAVPDAS